MSAQLNYGMIFVVQTQVMPYWSGLMLLIVMSTVRSAAPNLPTAIEPCNSTVHQRRPHPCLPLLELCRRTTEFAQLHSTLIKLGLIHNTLFSTRLAAFASISRSADIAYARRLFDRDPNPNSFAYNAMIRGHDNSPHPDHALALFSDMLTNGGVHAKPNNMTFPFVLKACSTLSALQEGRQVHGMVYKYGLEADSFIQNALIHMYVKSGSFSNALHLFDRMSHRDVVSWNTMLAGLVSMGFVKDAQELFNDMPEKNVSSWNCLIDGYVKCGLLEIARDLFDRTPVKNLITWNTMIGGYVGSNRMEEARHLFDHMPPELKDLTTFNVLIDGYSKDSGFSEVMELFKQMLVLKIEPDNFTLVSVLSCCSHLSALEQGEWIYSYVNNRGITLDAVLGTALLDMYAKCGRMERALVVFNSIEEKDIGVRNSMISTLGIHGCGKEALELFFELLETDTAPDEITFLTVLSACRHSGLVEEGQRCFNLMSQAFGIIPKAEHYGCMVDLLCRAGLLDEAKELIMANAGKEFSVAMWGALLGASSRLGNVEMGEYAAKHLLELDPDDARCYVALSNLYSRGGNWEKAAEVRKQMRSSGMEKVPGCSLIEVNGMVHEVKVGSGFDTLDEME